MPELALSDVARELGVSKSAATKYARLASFPKPRKLAGMRVWEADAVKAWGKEHLQKDKQGRPSLPVGRPPKQPSA